MYVWSFLFECESLLAFDVHFVPSSEQWLSVSDVIVCYLLMCHCSICSTNCPPPSTTTTSITTAQKHEDNKSVHIVISWLNYIWSYTKQSVRPLCECYNQLQFDWREQCVWIQTCRTHPPTLTYLHIQIHTHAPNHTQIRAHTCSSVKINAYCLWVGYISKNLFCVPSQTATSQQHI